MDAKRVKGAVIPFCESFAGWISLSSSLVFT